jgi:SAM-dependent methyltransferase
MMSDPIFVSSPTDVRKGDKALNALEQTNDTRFETDDGVLKVDDDRYAIAQAYERYSWLTHNINMATDRNEFHRDMLGGYAALPDNLGKYLELGCGVFTNTRFILPEHPAEKVYLLDPLIKDFVSDHPNCTYADGTLVGHDVEFVDKRIEDWNTRQKFDCIVMINVIPHCQDALAILDFIRKHIKKGGYVVLGEFPREHSAATHYDAGHPLALKAHILEDFLSEFEEVYRNGWYFIGQAT